MARRMPRKIAQLVTETSTELRKIYADRLKSVILYGSYARGDYRNGSDVDLLLLVENLRDALVERAVFSPIISRLSLKYDTVVSVIPMDIDDYERKKTPLLINVAKEGRPV